MNSSANTHVKIHNLAGSKTLESFQYCFEEDARVRFITYRSPSRYPDLNLARNLQEMRCNVRFRQIHCDFLSNTHSP